MVFLKNIRLLITVLLIIPLSSFGQDFSWPNGKKAVIVLSYDDGLDSHLDIAISQLNSVGFKGTFFLYGYLNENKFGEWKDVCIQGHEIGNHSLYHPCKGNTSNPESPRFISENYDVPSMLREIAMMNKLLYAITGEKPVSYAYPCGETMVGGVDYSDTLRQSGIVKFARKGQASSVITDFNDFNFLKVPGFSVAPGSNSEELIEYAQTVLKNKGLGIYIFHGIGGDYLTVDAKEHRALLEFLTKHNEDVWVTTFGKAMEYIKDKTNN